jgi:branched-chain amino acid transport system permease protein
MHDFLRYTVLGLVVGSGYAVAASGLVVTYTTSGIFNFAHGAIGMFMAFVYWKVHVDMGVPTLLALAIVLLVLAPLLGAAIERTLMRSLYGASTGAALVVTVGLMLTLLGGAFSFWPQGTARLLPEFFSGHQFTLAGLVITYHQATVVVVAALVALFLRLLFYRTRIGTAMRAVVDDPELLAMNGANPKRVGQASWALGASLASLAGILLAPLVTLEVLILTLLVLNCLAAAMLGRLKSLPVTFIGAILVALGENYIVGYGPGNVGSYRGALPSIFLLLVLLFLPQARLKAGRVVVARSPRVPNLRQSVFAGAAFVVIGIVVSGHLSRSNLATYGGGLAIALIMLSLVLLTGYGGQVSLCQLTFAGIGAFVMGRYFSGGSVLGLVACAAAAGLAGFLVSLPALRLQGLYLALTTFAVGRGMDLLFFSNSHVFGYGGRLGVPRIKIPGITFHGDRAFFILLLITFAVAGVGLLALRRGPFGRQLAAQSDSEAACATLGLSLVATKAIVFSVSAAMAGVAGALYGGLRGGVTQNDFLVLISLAVALSVYVGGINTVTGALIGGLFFAVLPTIGSHFPKLAQTQYLGTGMAAAIVGRFPNGIVGLISNGVDRARRQFAAAAVPDRAMEVEGLAASAS